MTPDDAATIRASLADLTEAVREQRDALTQTASKITIAADAIAKACEGAAGNRVFKAAVRNELAEIGATAREIAGSTRSTVAKGMH